MLKEKLGALLCRERPLPHMHRDQANKLGQPVDHSEDPVDPITTVGQVSDEIHAPTVKPGGGHWEGLQETCRRLSTILLTLTNLTGRHVGLDSLEHARPENTCREKSKGLGHSKVTTRRGVVRLIKEQLPTNPRNNQTVQVPINPVQELHAVQLPECIRGVLATTTCTQLNHFQIRAVLLSSLNTCEEGGFHHNARKGCTLHGQSCQKHSAPN